MPAERRKSSRTKPSPSISSSTSQPKPPPKSKMKPPKSKLTPSLPSPSSVVAPPPSLSSSQRYLLLFKSLNVSSHNRISMPVLISHVLVFLQSQSTSSSSAGSSDSAPLLLPISVTSYFQSGNLILSNLPPNLTSTSSSRSTSDEPFFSLPALQTYLSLHAHIESTLFLRTLPSLTHILTNCPFSTGPVGSDLETKVHVVFLEKLPGQEELEELRERVRKDGSEEMVWWPGDVEGGKEVVLLLPNGVGKAKCGAGVVEKVLGMKGTMRGWRTLRACAGLLE
ncbi:hypothetical protein BDY24DRAFT_417565 [Mrakia frigida]|uniref:uncharacterized protein n=1 Tax=Mrakia frigida TaxID=29902 RepID=UPI003FCC0F6F